MTANTLQGEKPVVPSVAHQGGPLELTVCQKGEDVFPGYTYAEYRQAGCCCPTLAWGLTP